MHALKAQITEAKAVPKTASREKQLRKDLRKLTGRPLDRDVLNREVRRSGGDRIGALLYLITRARIRRRLGS
jgi:hypothetical protein